MIFYYIPTILISAVILVWFVRYVSSVRRGDYQHTPGSKRVWWVPGGGGHGGGGQVPPLIPDDED